jgi:small conductance mechanosensitive channel
MLKYLLITENLPDNLLSGETVETVAQEVGIFTQWLEQMLPKALSFAIQVILAVIVFFIGTRLIRFIRKRVRKSMERTNCETGLVQFIDSIVKVVCYFLLIMAILAGFGFETGAVVAVLGSSGLTIGLAFQGSLSNFAGGVLILLIKPFVVGDYILENSGKNEGTVTHIDMFYTTLLTVDNKRIVIPNGSLANTSLVNYSTMEKRRVDITVGVSYQADLRRAKAVLEAVMLREPKRCTEEELTIFVSELGESSVSIGTRMWVKTEDYWDVTWRLTEEFKYALDEAGISIPYPQMDVHISQNHA